MRKFWIEFHRLSGLIILIPLLLQSISGSIIVFDHAIDEWLNPELTLPHTVTETPAPLSKIFTAIYTQVPNIERIDSIRSPRHSQAMYTAFISTQKASANYGKRIEVAINPYTAEIVSTREWGSYFTSFIYLLHYTLLLGHNGELALGFLAILMLVNVIVGVYYGWPKSTKAWNWLLARTHKKSPVIAQYRRLHILAGLISLPVFIVLITTGISLIFPVQTALLFDRPAKPALLNNAVDHQPANADLWLPQIAKLWPDANWKRIIPTGPDKAFTEVRLNTPIDPRKTSGSTTVWLTPSSAEVITSLDYRNMRPRQQALFWLFPLHSGEAFGTTGRVIVFIGGLLTTLLTLAGAGLWYKRKYRSRRTT